MLQSEVQTAARAAHLHSANQAVLRALTADVPASELMTSIATTIDNFHAEQYELPGMQSCNGDAPLLTELPPGWLTIADAARTYDIAYPNLYAWVKKGHVPVKGRIRQGPGRCAW